MAIIAYLRVSSTDQNLARQEDMAKAAGAEQIFKEKLSGKDTNRPELKRMLEYARTGDELHIESLSRLGRSTRDLLEIVQKLTDKGIKIISHKENIDTDTPTGRFILTVFAALAEMERESIRDRQREGIEAAKQRGVKLGPPTKMIDPELIRQHLEGKISISNGAKAANVGLTTFKKACREYREKTA